MSKGPRAHWAVITFSRCTEMPDEDTLQDILNEALTEAGQPTVKKVTYVTDQAITLNVDLGDVCAALDESEREK